MKPRTATLLAALTILAALSAGCADDGSAFGDGPLVVATTSILGDIATQVAAEDAEVQVLIPVGVDPHEFSPSPREAALLEDADLVVANGLGLEEGLADTLADADAVLEVAAEVDPVPLEEHGGAAQEEDGEEHADDGLDPHVWMDPIRMADAALLIGNRLSEAAPGDWEERADRYAERLRDLDEEIRVTLEAIPADRRGLVTNHESLGYFAGRYDLSILGAVIPGGTTLGEPSAAGLSELAALIRERDVPAIFAETTQPSALAEALAEEVGRPVEIVELFTESLGPPGSGADTYVDLMRTNARLVAEALG